MPLLEKLNFVLENNFKRVSYTEAIDILRDCTIKKKSSTISLTNGVPTYNQSTLLWKNFKCPVLFLRKYQSILHAFKRGWKNSSRHGHSFPGIGKWGITKRRAF
jgi:asparaginyl-tRNA synthetase